MKKKLVLCIITCFTHMPTAWADPVISFFVKPYPLINNRKYSQEVIRTFEKPGKIAAHAVYGISRDEIMAGLFSTYAGFLATSNLIGQTTFPRLHEPPQISLVITSKMTPIIISGNTIHHWELEPGTPARMYSVERKQDDETQLHYWDVQEADLPENNRIPLDALVLLAKPKHVHVPIGITITTESPNLVLPDIYVKRGLNIASNALYILNLKHFFGKLRTAYQKQGARYSYHVIQ